MYTEVYITEMCKELGCMQIIASCNKYTSYYQGHAKMHTYTVFSLLHKLTLCNFQHRWLYST